MTTLIKYRQYKTGKTALISTSKVLEITQRDFPNGTSILVTFPKNVYEKDPWRHSTTIASDLDARVAEMVTEIIANAVHQKEPLLDMHDAVQMAESVVGHSGACIEEVFG